MKSPVKRREKSHSPSNRLGKRATLNITEVVFCAKDKNGDFIDVRGPKASLVLASSVMKSMLSTKWHSKDTKVHIKNFHAETLQLLIEFVENHKLLTPTDFDDIIQLALAADFFMIKSLVPFCARQFESKVNFENVWLALNLLLRHEDLGSVIMACIKVVQNETDKCLAHGNYYLAQKESIIFMLQQNKLHVEDEIHLLRQCWLWAMQQPTPLVELRDLLPFLRLEAEWKERVERLINLNPSSEDFTSLFELILDRCAESPSITKCREFTLPSPFARKAMAQSRCFNIGEEMPECFKLEDMNVGVHFKTGLRITATEDFILEGFVLPPFFEVDPLWVFVNKEDGSRSCESSASKFVNCFYSVEVSSKHRKYSFEGKVKCRLCIMGDNALGTMEEFFLKHPEQLLKGEAVTVSITISVDQPCKWRISTMVFTRRIRKYALFRVDLSGIVFIPDVMLKQLCDDE